MDGRKADRRRARPEARIGRARAIAVATRLGVALRDARHRSGLTQAEVGDAAGVSQTLVSGIERGHGAATSVETWARLAAAVGEQFVAFLEQAPGSDRPRDIEHVRRQSALIAVAANGGWSALPELAIDDGPGRSRSIDVALIRRQSGEAIVVEVWDWLDDVGASLRGLDGKVAALERRLATNRTSQPAAAGMNAPPPPTTTDRTRHQPAAGLNGPASTPTTVAIDRARDQPAAGRDAPTPPSAPAASPTPSDDSGDRWRVRGLFVLRETRRNRRLVAELRPLFAARFGGSSVAWIHALHSTDSPMPADHGLIWADRHLHLTAARLGRAG